MINTATNTVSKTIAVGFNPPGVTVSPDGTRVYVTSPQNNTVSVIETATNTVISTIAVGSNPFGVRISPDGNFVYVSNPYDRAVSVIYTGK